MSFAEEFISQRKKLNISQEEAGKRIGLSRSYITLIEKGKRLPGKKHIAKIAEALQLKKYEVINWYLQDLRDKLT